MKCAILFISIMLQVVSFEDLQNGEGVDMAKPMFCTIHASENLKYFCNTCQVCLILSEMFLVYKICFEEMLLAVSSS